MERFSEVSERFAGVSVRKQKVDEFSTAFQVLGITSHRPVEGCTQRAKTLFQKWVRPVE